MHIWELNYLIVYLHGFRSSGNGGKVQLLREMFPEIDVIGFDYHPHKPKNAEEELSQLLSTNSDKEILLIGTSLGGFWARWGARNFGVTSILINPSLHPDVTLRAGIYESYLQSDPSIEVTDTDLTEFKEYKVPPIPGTHATVCSPWTMIYLMLGKRHKSLKSCIMLFVFQTVGIVLVSLVI